MYRFFRLAPLMSSLIILAACSTPTVPSSPQVIAIATEEVATLPVSTVTVSTLPAEDKPASSAATAVAAPILVATEVPTTTPTSETIDWLTTATVDGNHYVLGNPNAPIRLVDYSDFL